jgi:hypothetical protein
MPSTKCSHGGDPSDDQPVDPDGHTLLSQSTAVISPGHRVPPVSRTRRVPTRDGAAGQLKLKRAYGGGKSGNIHPAAGMREVSCVTEPANPPNSIAVTGVPVL